MNAEQGLAPGGGEVIVYEAPDGGPRVEVIVGDDTVWLTQRQVADLFDTSTDNVGSPHQERLHGRRA